MRHETFELTAPEGGIAQSAIGTLLGMAGELDARFLPVGEALLKLVETVDSVVQGLAAMRTAFSDGQADVAIADLTEATRCLIEAPGIQARRRACLAELGGKVTALSSLSADLDRVLYVLQFYSLNIKIAAGGDAEFVDFADEMNSQLATGREQLAGFAATVGQLLDQLAGMSGVDRKLAVECHKLIPAVPDQLAGAAGELRVQQQRVIAVVDMAEQIAGAIRTRIAQALGAIQIGDSARQRIEHIAFACELMASLAANGTSADREALGHMAALCVAQLDAIGSEFTAEARKLLQTLESLLPDTRRLLESTRNEQSVMSSNVLIARLEAGIGDSAELTSQLQQANADVAALLEFVVATIDGLGTRVERVRDLGIEVGYMSVNANLRCRRDQAISQPVAVIAREIKAHSRLIDEVSGNFVSVSTALVELSGQISGNNDSGSFDVRAALSSSLVRLSEVSERTGEGMVKVTVDCDGIADRLESTAHDLRESIVVAEGLERVCADLRMLAEPVEAGAALGEAHPLPAMLERLHAAYTMVQERTVHSRFVLADTGASAAAAMPPPLPSAGLVDDEDALF